MNILWSTPVRVEKITPELAGKMKKSGCYNVGIGIESANNEILVAMDKHLTIEQVTASVHIFKEAGIEVLGQFVIGSPGDTLETVKESIAYAKNSELDFVMFYSVLPFKGTPQWDYVESNGRFLAKTIHEYHRIKPRIVFETPEFSTRDRLEAIRLATLAGFYSDSNDRDDFFDFGRELVKRAQNYLPDSLGNRIYLASKHLYRKLKVSKKH